MTIIFARTIVDISRRVVVIEILNDSFWCSLKKNMFWVVLYMKILIRLVLHNNLKGKTVATLFHESIVQFIW